MQTCFNIALAVGLASLASSAQAQHPVSIAANDGHIIFSFANPGHQQVIMYELRPYEEFSPDGSYPVCFQGMMTEEPVVIDRFDDGRDRLYSKYKLVDGVSGHPLAAPQYVTDLSGLKARDFEIPWPEEIKGLTCIVDIEDAVEVGARYADEGIVLGLLIDWQNPNPEMTWEVDGVEVPINAGYVRHLDSKYRTLTELGVNMTPIPVNHIPTEPQPGNPLIHPRTDLANAPMHHGAFNLTDEEGLRTYRAAIEFIAERYTRPDGEHGLISGIVVGNELQSHWAWHNIGKTPQDEVIADYVRAVRIAWLAANKYHRGLRVYASFTHHWTKRGELNHPLKEIPGDELLQGINEAAKREGDFPWHVAFHPYPEDLFEPRFWDDVSAIMHFQSPRITFNNLEVLTKYLRQEEFLFDGQPRRIILSEQGFHTPDGPEGEALQAAAFAYAYHKVSHMPEIDAFIYHRHVSARDEGGLCLGLWTWDPDGPTGFEPGDKKLLWDVFKAAGTDQQEEVFAFALPIIGIESWDEAMPKSPNTVGMEPVEHLDTENVLFDLYELLYKAEVSVVMPSGEIAEYDLPGGWRSAVVVVNDWPTKSIFHHPPDEGVGHARYELQLPAANGDQLLLTFNTAITAESANGVGFSIQVDNEPVFDVIQVEGTPIQRAVDLTPWAGQEIDLILQIDALGDTHYDWANWVLPQIKRH